MQHHRKTTAKQKVNFKPYRKIGHTITQTLKATGIMDNRTTTRAKGQTVKETSMTDQESENKQVYTFVKFFRNLNGNN